MSNEEALRRIELFKLERRNQVERIAVGMSMAPTIEAIASSVASEMGNDPLTGHPILRSQKVMPDHETQWGIILPVVTGFSMQILLDKKGSFWLQDDNGKRELPGALHSFEPQAVTLLLPGDQPGQVRGVELRELIYDFVARQLDREK
ncbi:MAG TPA: hypothetical protein VGU66_05815 [Candidatus Elarobacter sp.]|nr:hypothetical protein [Candidatus Elarobacter sp.]